MFEQSILRISFQCLQLPWKCTHKSNVQNLFTTIDQINNVWHFHEKQIIML